VPLRQRGADQRVLHPGEDPIADELVPGHAAAPRRPRLEHPGAEHDVALVPLERADEVLEPLRRVLPVAVQQHHDVEPWSIAQR